MYLARLFGCVRTEHQCKEFEQGPLVHSNAASVKLATPAHSAAVTAPAPESGRSAALLGKVDNLPNGLFSSEIQTQLSHADAPSTDAHIGHTSTYIQHKVDDQGASSSCVPLRSFSVAGDAAVFAGDLAAQGPSPSLIFHSQKLRNTTVGHIPSTQNALWRDPSFVSHADVSVSFPECGSPVVNIGVGPTDVNEVQVGAVDESTAFLLDSSTTLASVTQSVCAHTSVLTNSMLHERYGASLQPAVLLKCVTTQQFSVQSEDPHVKSLLPGSGRASEDDVFTPRSFTPVSPGRCSTPCSKASLEIEPSSRVMKRPFGLAGLKPRNSESRSDSPQLNGMSPLGHADATPRESTPRGSTYNIPDSEASFGSAQSRKYPFMNSLVPHTSYLDVLDERSQDIVARNTSKEGMLLQMLKRMTIPYVNQALKNEFGIKCAAECKQVLHSWMEVDPGSWVVLQESLANACDGTMDPVSRIIPQHKPDSGVVTFRSVKVVPMWHVDEEGGEADLGLLLVFGRRRRKNTAAAQALIRDRQLLSKVPAMITLFTLEGKVLRQNAPSIAMFGTLVAPDDPEDEPGLPHTPSTLPTPFTAPSHASAAADGDGRPRWLQQLFCQAPEKLEVMMAAVRKGKRWTDVVSVPPMYFGACRQTPQRVDAGNAPTTGVLRKLQSSTSLASVASAFSQIHASHAEKLGQALSNSLMDSYDELRTGERHSRSSLMRSQLLNSSSGAGPSGTATNTHPNTLRTCPSLERTLNTHTSNNHPSLLHHRPSLECLANAGTNNLPALLRSRPSSECTMNATVGPNPGSGLEQTSSLTAANLNALSFNSPSPNSRSSQFGEGPSGSGNQGCNGWSVGKPGSGNGGRGKISLDVFLRGNEISNATSPTVGNGCNGRVSAVTSGGSIAGGGPVGPLDSAGSVAGAVVGVLSFGSDLNARSDLSNLSSPGLGPCGSGLSHVMSQMMSRQSSTSGKLPASSCSLGAFCHEAEGDNDPSAAEFPRTRAMLSSLSCSMQQRQNQLDSLTRRRHSLDTAAFLAGGIGVHSRTVSPTNISPGASPTAAIVAATGRRAVSIDLPSTARHLRQASQRTRPMDNPYLSTVMETGGSTKADSSSTPRDSGEFDEWRPRASLREAPLEFERSNLAPQTTATITNPHLPESSTPPADTHASTSMDNHPHPPPHQSPIAQQLSSARQTQSSAGIDESSSVYYELQASIMVDPCTLKRVVMLVGTDASGRVKAQQRLSNMLEAQRGWLNQCFPRHVIEDGLLSPLVHSPSMHGSSAASVPASQSGVSNERSSQSALSQYGVPNGRSSQSATLSQSGVSNGRSSGKGTSGNGSSCRVSVDGTRSGRTSSESRVSGAASGDMPPPSSLSRSALSTSQSATFSPSMQLARDSGEGGSWGTGSREEDAVVVGSIPDAEDGSGSLEGSKLEGSGSLEGSKLEDGSRSLERSKLDGTGCKSSKMCGGSSKSSKSFKADGDEGEAVVVCVREEEEEEAPVGAAAPGVDLVPPALAKKHEEVTVVFIMVMGFDDMLRGGEPGQALTFLAQLFNKIDALVDEHQVYKVETKGACYVAAGGLMRKDTQGGYVVQDEPGGVAGAVNMMEFAQALQVMSKKLVPPSPPSQHQGASSPSSSPSSSVQLVIGLHTGELVSGVAGRHTPWYCLFGDTMNMASRMQSTCPLGAVQVSTETHEFLAGTKLCAQLTPTGGVLVKGKGTLNTYTWQPQ